MIPFIVVVMLCGAAYAAYDFYCVRRCDRCRIRLMQHGPARPNWWYCLGCGANFEEKKK